MLSASLNETFLSLSLVKRERLDNVFIVMKMHQANHCSDFIQCCHWPMDKK